MKISCTQENLSKAVQAVGRVIGNRGTLPILNHILLATDNGRLKVAGTDLEMGIVAYCGAKVEREGSIAIPARLLTEFVTANPDKTLAIEVDGTTIKVASSHVSATLKGLSSEDFPLIPDVKGAQKITVSSADLKSAISQVAFAVALDESRPVLAGVYLKINKDSLTLAATDSYRLTERVLTISTDVKEEIITIVPVKTFQEVARIITAQPDVIIEVSSSQIRFTIDSVVVVSRVLEGTFPPYNQIIPKETKTTTEIKSNDLLNALKLGSSFAREVANTIRLVVTAGEPLKVIATSPQSGDTTAMVDGKTEGENLEISFNAKYLSDSISACGETNVTIQFNGNLAPIIIKPVGDKKYRSLVMPLRSSQSDE